jgi:hypothetical protein
MGKTRLQEVLNGLQKESSGDADELFDNDEEFALNKSKSVVVQTKIADKYRAGQPRDNQSRNLQTIREGDEAS